MVLKHRPIPHMGMHGPFRRMIAENLGSSPLGGNHPKGHADPAWRLCAALLLATAGDLTVNRADRVPLKVQYPRTPKRPGVPRERERTFISAGDVVSNLV